LKFANSNIPASNHLTSAYFELERFSSRDTAVKDFTTQKFSSVMNFDHRALWNRLTNSIIENSDRKSSLTENDISFLCFLLLIL